MYGAPRSSGLLPAATLAELERLVLALGRLPGAMGAQGGKGRPAGFGLEFFLRLAFNHDNHVSVCSVLPNPMSSAKMPPNLSLAK